MTICSCEHNTGLTPEPPNSITNSYLHAPDSLCSASHMRYVTSRRSSGTLTGDLMQLRINITTSLANLKLSSTRACFLQKYLLNVAVCIYSKVLQVFCLCQILWSTAKRMTSLWKSSSSPRLELVLLVCLASCTTLFKQADHIQSHFSGLPLVYLDSGPINVQRILSLQGGQQSVRVNFR